MRSEKDIMTLIIHGVGVEGKAALKWFLEKSDAAIILIDTSKKCANLSTDLKPVGRVLLTTEAEFISTTLPTDEAALYLRSPGVPPANPVFRAIRTAGIPHTTPTGYWLARHAPAHLVTITGTKGKSSTASLTALILQWAGRKAEVMGNIGKTPYEVTLEANTICIFELSSYMMHDLPPTRSLHVVINLYTEHTDWHESHEAYIKDKLRVFSADPASKGLVTKHVAEWLPAEHEHITFLEDAVQLNKDSLSLGSAEPSLTPATLNDAFASPSMLLALRAAISICLKQKFLTPTEIITTLEQNLPHWQGLPSRQQIIPSTDGIVWVDDALATIPEATISALTRWQNQRVHLLLGGRDRGQDFTGLMKICSARKDVLVYSFDATHAKIEAASDINPNKATSLESMIKQAVQAAGAGDVILFSPAAPSAPPHANYQERSAIFQGFIPLAQVNY